jgi:hypothetical protein
MWNAVRKPNRLAGPGVNALPIDFYRQDPGGDQAFFVLEMMDVPRRALSMRGERAAKFKHDFPVTSSSPNLEHIARVPVLQPQRRG